MSAWWNNYNQQSGFPQGFSDWIQYANQVKGISKEKLRMFAVLYRLFKIDKNKKSVDKRRGE